MSLVLSDRVKETTITTGTGTVSLGGTFGAFQSFGSSVGDGNQTYYGIENESRWEVGLGTYSASGDTLSRDTVFDSSVGPGSGVNLNGVSIVFCTYPGSKAVFLNSSGELDLTTVSGVFFNGTTSLNNIEISGNLTLTPYENQVTTFKLSEAGNIFHSYVDGVYDRTVSLHNDGEISPTWKLGLKSTPDDISEPPSHGYVYGQDGEAGLVANSTTSFGLSHANGLIIKHQGSDFIKAHAVTGAALTADGDLHLGQSLNPAKLNIHTKFVTASSYERLSIYGQLSNNFIIAAEADGVGAVRDIEFPTAVQFTGDVAIDKTTEDAALINFRATEDADATSAISTLTNSSATTHHIQVEINGVKAWIACSTTDPT